MEACRKGSGDGREESAMAPAIGCFASRPPASSRHAYTTVVENAVERFTTLHLRAATENGVAVMPAWSSRSLRSPSPASMSAGSPTESSRIESCMSAQPTFNQYEKQAGPNGKKIDLRSGHRTGICRRKVLGANGSLDLDK